MSGCELSNGLSRPIDAFVKYFLDVKPYHTKILEVIEQYKFNESITVQIDETILTRIDIANTALCHPTGFGIIFDDECGFDAIDCCDLFECLGGYGLIFDNSDLLVNLPIVAMDEDADTITVSGDVTADSRLQIAGINTANTLRVTGDKTAEFTTHNIFFIVHYKTHVIVNTTATDFIISGDNASEFFSRKEFRAFNAGANNGVYSVKGVSYDATTDRTSITVSSQDVAPLEAGLTGYLEIRAANKNNGAYQVDSVEFTGIETIVTINQNNGQFFEYIGEAINGSVQFRTGLIPPRRVWVSNPDTLTESEFKIVDSTYDVDNDQTILTLAENIDQPISGLGNVKLYGYMFGAGFDGYEECTIPKPANVHINIGEVLNIILSPGVTPTPTPTVTITPSITPTHTVTPTVTPTISLTPTITPTVSITPSITPTITPTISLTPTITPTVTPTITPTITPTVTVTPSSTPTEEGDGQFMLFAGSPVESSGDTTPLLAFRLNTETFDPIILDTVEGAPSYPSARGIDYNDNINSLAWYDTDSNVTIYNLENSGLVLDYQFGAPIDGNHRVQYTNDIFFTAYLTELLLPEYTVNVIANNIISGNQVGFGYSASHEMGVDNFNAQMMDNHLVIRARNSSSPSRLNYIALSFVDGAFNVALTTTPVNDIIPNSGELIEEFLPNAQILKERTLTPGNTVATTVHYDQSNGLVVDTYDFIGDVPDMSAIYGFAYDPIYDVLAITYISDPDGTIAVVLYSVSFTAGIPNFSLIGTPKYFPDKDISEISYYNSYLGVREANTDIIEAYYFNGTELTFKDSTADLTNVGGRWIKNIFNTVYEPDSFAFRSIPNADGAVDFYGYEDSVTNLLAQAPSAPLSPVDGEVRFILPFQTSPSDNFVTYIVIDEANTLGSFHTYSVNLDNTLTLLSTQSSIGGDAIGGLTPFLLQRGISDDFYYVKSDFGTGLSELFRYSFDGTQFSKVGSSISLGQHVESVLYSSLSDLIVYAYNNESTSSFLNYATDNGSTFTLGTPQEFSFDDYSAFGKVQLVNDSDLGLGPITFIVNNNVHATLTSVLSELVFNVVDEYDFLSLYGISDPIAVANENASTVTIAGNNPALSSTFETNYITVAQLLWDSASNTFISSINLNYNTYNIDVESQLVILTTQNSSGNPVLIVLNMQPPTATIDSLNTDSLSLATSGGQLKWFFTNTGA